MSYKDLFSKKHTDNDYISAVKAADKATVGPSVKETETKIIKKVSSSNK